MPAAQVKVICGAMAPAAVAATPSVATATAAVANALADAIFGSSEIEPTLMIVRIQ